MTAFQSFAMWIHLYTMVIGPILFLFCLYLPALRLFMAAYVLYVLLDGRPSSGKPLSSWQHSFRKLKWWHLLASFCPVNLHKSVDLDPTQQYVFGYHPHGVLAFGAFSAIGTDGANWSTLFPGIEVRLLTIPHCFWPPIFREVLLGLGLGSVANRSCISHLDNAHQSICIVVGGARESVLSAKDQTYRLVLGQRRGFIRVAVSRGVSLVPVLGFGETELYHKTSFQEGTSLGFLHGMAEKIVGFTIPTFYGKSLWNPKQWGLMPFKHPIDVVVGKPIPVKRNLSPSKEELDWYHQRYVSALIKLWEEERLKYRGNSLRILD